MRPVAYNDRALYIGKTTSGKSTLCRWFWGQMVGCRRFCVNVKGTADVGGVEPVYDVRAIDWTAPVVNFVPTFIKPADYEPLYAAILEHGGPTNVWLDEGYGPTTGNQSAASLIRLQTQGAGMGIGHSVCSQRPQDIAVPLRTEAEHIFLVVPPISYPDLQALAREISYLESAPCGPRELSDLLRGVQQEHGNYATVWWQRESGEYVVIPPMDPGEVGAPLPEAWTASPEASAPEPAADTPAEHDGGPEGAPDFNSPDMEGT